MRNKIYYKLLLICFLVVSPAINAQVNIVSDNFFVLTGIQNQLDVLKNDNPGSCGTEALVLEVLTPSPGLGVQWSVTNDNRIQFEAVSGTQGQYKIEYKITCSSDASTSTGYAYVNIAEKPQFLDDASCVVDPPIFTWDIEKKTESSLLHNLQPYAQAFSGDINGDGKIEIVALNQYVYRSDSTQWSNEIYIFDSDLNFLKSIPVGIISSYVVSPIAIGDVDNDGVAEIIVGLALQDDNASSSYKLRAYRYDGTLVWESSDPYIQSLPGNNGIAYSLSPVIDDIDGDGNVEILIGTRIYAGESGKLLATLPSGGRGRRSRVVNTFIYADLPAIGDIDGDGIKEIVGGRTTYKVTIISRDNPELNSAVVLAESGLKDGFTSLADIDGDGILDVIVVGSDSAGNNPNGLMYVWQGSSSDLIGNTIDFGSATHAMGSRPFIGDIDGDGRPDIAFTYYRGFVAYKYNGSTYDKMLEAATTDSSGATTMSMFDFNNDGVAELIYRDQTDLKIIKHDGTVLMSIPCFSGTHTEYPIVVDIDGNGHASIIVSGANVLSDRTSFCRLMKFGSETPNTWSSARSVWHQHAYNPLSVNDDLSIPSNPLSPTTQFIREDGSVHTPFNNFLQQASVLNTHGNMLLKTADLAFNTLFPQKINYDEVTDQLKVTANITNVGSVDYSGNLLLTLYAYSPATLHYDIVQMVTINSQEIEIGENKVYNLVVPFFMQNIQGTLPADMQWFLAVNVDLNVVSDWYYENQIECQSWNNKTNNISFASGAIVLCEGDSHMLTVAASDSYECHWFTPGSGGANVPYPDLSSNIGYSKNVTKASGTDVDYYLIDTYLKSSNQKLNMEPDTIYVYRSPDSLVWVGRVDADWHNQLNWHNPADPNKNLLASYIPRACTNVLIPERDSLGVFIEHYSDLSSLVTNYTIYPSGICNNITFEHGGELLHSEQLTYSKAYVQLTMNSNRWYCFAPPLRDFYTGDIYRTNPSPIVDQMYVFTRLYSQREPQWGSYVEGFWSRAFNNPDVSFEAGQAVGVWLDDWDPVITNTSTISMDFPKLDPYFYLYDEEDGSIASDPITTDRTNSHRFIFENSINATTKEISLLVEATSAGKDIMVGNPFMAHLDFDKFYAKNSALIENYYKLIEANGTYATYYGIGDGRPSTGSPTPLTKLVAPMQAVLLTPKSTFVAGSLVITPDMVDGTSRAKLRNAVDLRKGDSDIAVIKVGISDDQTRNRSSLFFSPDANQSLNYNSETDVVKVIKSGSKSYPSIYFISDDGYFMDIKGLDIHNNINIPIGIAYDGTGKLAIGFENLWDVDSKYYVYLKDKLLDKLVNLRESSIYCFEKADAATFLNDRFVLMFTDELTGISDEPVEKLNLTYFVVNDNLIVQTKDGSNISSLAVYDMQGRIVTSVREPKTSITTPISKGVFVINLLVDGKQYRFKVIN